MKTFVHFSCSAAVLLGLATLTGGCMDPANIERQRLDHDEQTELDHERDEPAADELDHERDGAEPTAEAPVMASCAMWSGHSAGEPSASSPTTTHPVVGYKLDSLAIKQR